MIGSTLKHYRIVDKLGQGGMASVYRADDLRLDRQVALKVLPPDLASDPRRIERFEREAKAVAALNHPNIVTIYSVEEADGIHFLTMELVDGRSLAESIPEGGLEPARFLELARPLLAAVAAAHRRGIVHRDIKPANVMVNSEGVVKLLDLGLAKLDGATGGLDSGEETLTAEGRVIGTVPYMAPEQLTGRPIDHRIDIYALGVLFHEMLTGRRPFRADSTAELISAILRDPPPRLAESRSSLPRGLEEAVDRCLEKQPHYRFQSAEELAEAVDEAEAGLGVSASREVWEAPGREPGRRAARRSRWLPAAGLGLALTAAASLAFLLYPSTGRAPAAAPVDLSLVLLPLEEIGEPGDPELSAELAAELREALGAVGGLELTEGLPAPGTGGAAAADPDYLLAAVLEWSGAPAGEQAQLSFELTRGADGAAIWSESFGRPELGTRIDRSAVASAVRARIGDLLGLPTPPAPRLSQAPAPGPSPGGVTTRRPPEEARGPPPTSATVEEKPGVAASESPPTGEPRAVRPAARAELAIHVVSSLPAGVVTVYADGERVYERAFEFTERKAGFLGRVGLRRRIAGELSDSMLVPAAMAGLRIYVTLPGEPARHFELDPRLRGDGIQRLVIDIRKRQEIEVRLE
jgi:hypothetical protein